MDNSRSILLVDDDEVDVMNMQRAVQKNWLRGTLQVAENGLQALQMLRRDKAEKLRPQVQMIVTDINMPRMNGIDFIRALRADSELQNMLVFVMTTSNNDGDRRAAYALNVAGYILKPVEPNKFMAAMKILDSYWSLIEGPWASG
ncbi:MAG TPA: response regulator [Gammaproteobacteria bacterium]|nr:response regulator [Gammaproteobacteria bacterium]